MSCFYLPSGLCHEIEQLMCNFLWSNSDSSRKLHWMNWKRLSARKEDGGLGFRELERFNLALLARQGWRLIQHPDTLVAKLYKASYFPRSNFLNAAIGYCPSYCWRSIVKTRDVIVAGSRWEIGNGSDVNVWKDRWLPRPLLFKPICGLSGEHELLVLDLIDWEHKCWRKDLLETIFMPCDVEIVLNIHLFDPLLQDRLVWHYTKDGKFTVKSAYHLMNSQELSSLGFGEVSESANGRVFWKKLWKIQVPPRVRSFLWRACRSILPCKVNLLHRHVVSEPWCDRCGQAESTMHAIFACGLFSEVWSVFPAFYSFGVNSPSFLSWAACIIGLSNEEQSLWAFLCWKLWHARNKHLFEKVYTSSGDLVEECMSSEEYLRVHVKKNERPCDLFSAQAKWQFPADGWVKINVDAAVKGNEYGIGIIGRKSNGEVVFAGARRIQDGSNVETAEAEAALWGLKMGEALGLQRVILESDSMKLVNLAKNGEMPLNSFGNVMALVVDRSYSFSLCEWSFCRRHANRAADWLSRWRPLVPFFVSSDFSFPLEFYDVLETDLS